MRIRENITKMIQRLDESYLAVDLAVVGDRPGMRGLLFHTVFADHGEIASDYIHPQQSLTIDHYKQLFEYLLNQGYQFLSYSDLNDQLNPQGLYAYVTFDDGYYNNVRIIPVIEEYKIPIHLFVTTKNILENKKFWWDIIYQRRTQLGVDRRKIEAELRNLKKRSYDEVENYITREFGMESFRPLSDLDRPLLPEELREISKHELITIGNHTRSHTSLTSLPIGEVECEIAGAREDTIVIIEKEPVGFSFPSGEYRAEHLGILRSMGIDVAFSCLPKVSKIPSHIRGNKRLVIGRYCVSGRINRLWQSKIIRAGASPFFVAQRIAAFFRTNVFR